MEMKSRVVPPILDGCIMEVIAYVELIDDHVLRWGCNSDGKEKEERART